jgi:hypothetical protein
MTREKLSPLAQVSSAADRMTCDSKVSFFRASPQEDDFARVIAKQALFSLSPFLSFSLPPWRHPLSFSPPWCTYTRHPDLCLSPLITGMRQATYLPTQGHLAGCKQAREPRVRSSTRSAISFSSSSSSSRSPEWS